MKRGLLLIGWVIGMATIMVGCQKDIDLFIPDNNGVQGPDTTWHNAIPASASAKALQASLAPQVYIDTFEVNNNPATLTSPDGLTCKFPPMCCVTLSGQPVTGKVAVQMLLIQKKGDMVAASKPTSSNGRLLISGGELFVTLTKNGEELKLAQGKSISLKYNETQPNQSMKVFYGDESNTDRFNWLPSDSGGAMLPVFAINNAYEFNSAQLRWINCDYFFDTTGVNRVKVKLSLAPIYTNANTVVYLVFNNLRSVLGMYGDATTRQFQSGLVPVGQPATIVVMSRIGNDYFVGTQNFVIGSNITGSNTQLVSVTPALATLPGIKAMLATL